MSKSLSIGRERTGVTPALKNPGFCFRACLPLVWRLPVFPIKTEQYGGGGKKKR